LSARCLALSRPMATPLRDQLPRYARAGCGIAPVSGRRPSTWPASSAASAHAPGDACPPWSRFRLRGACVCGVARQPAGPAACARQPLLAPDGPGGVWLPGWPVAECGGDGNPGSPRPPAADAPEPAVVRLPGPPAGPCPADAFPGSPESVVAGPGVRAV